MPSLVRCVALILVCVFCTWPRETTAAESSIDSARKPNIVFVLADDVGWADVGYNRARFYETPNIDRLSEDGLTFDRFYPGGPNCAPSRACMMTGMYTPRHHLYQPGGKSKGNVKKMRWKVPTRGSGEGFNTFVSHNDWIEKDWTSVAEVLKTAGYVTARLGKWHLGDDVQGFDYSTNDGLHAFSSEHKSNQYSSIDVAERLTDRALEFIQENKESPFFLYLSHWEAHVPLRADAEITAKYEEKKSTQSDQSFNWRPSYAAEIEVIDTSVGRLRDRLSQLGLAQNTIFIFSSDNGGLPGVTKNAPLRGGKGSLFEGGIRTPFVVSWPSLIEPGTSTDIPITGVDLLPTLAEVAGAALPTTQPVDGVSVLPLWKGEQLEERSLYWHYPLYLEGKGNAKVLPIYGTEKLYWRAVPASAVVRGDWKLIHYYEYGTHKLFNLSEDIGEQNNLAESNPSQATKLHEMLMQWVEETGSPVPEVKNPLFSVSQKNRNTKP